MSNPKVKRKVKTNQCELQSIPNGDMFYLSGTLYVKLPSVTHNGGTYNAARVFPEGTALWSYHPTCVVTPVKKIITKE